MNYKKSNMDTRCHGNRGVNIAIVDRRSKYITGLLPTYVIHRTVVKVKFALIWLSHGLLTNGKLLMDKVGILKNQKCSM